MPKRGEKKATMGAEASSGDGGGQRWSGDERFIFHVCLSNKAETGHSTGQMHGHSGRLPPINSSFDRERAARESERAADNAKIRDNERGREGTGNARNG